MTAALLTSLQLLAEDTAPTNTGPEFGKASPLGLLVVVLLLVGTFFLVRSMNRHLRKLPESFDRGRPGPGRSVGDGTAAGRSETASDDDGDAGGTDTTTPRDPSG